jgi:FkbM family methyltransferase
MEYQLVREYETGGRRFRVNLGNRWEKWRWDQLTTRSKEPETLQWIEDTLSNDCVFFDIGANIGNYTIYAGICHPRCRIFAFEAEPNSFVQLSRNIMLNKIQAVPFLMALSDRAEINLFHTTTFSAGRANHQFARTQDDYEQSFEPAFSFGIHSISVDALIASGTVPIPNFVKIDVDGNEDRIIRGMEVTLGNSALQSILCEISGTEDKVDTLVTHICDSGFNLVRRPPKPSGGNWIFMRV